MKAKRKRQKIRDREVAIINATYKQIMNTLYGKMVTDPPTAPYVDTDSVIYQDFNKKQEI